MAYPRRYPCRAGTRRLEQRLGVQAAATRISVDRAGDRRVLGRSPVTMRAGTVLAGELGQLRLDLFGARVGQGGSVGELQRRYDVVAAVDCADQGRGCGILLDV